MNKINKLVICLLLAGTSSVYAQKTGPSIAIYGSFAGAEVEGSGSAGTKTGSGTVGMITPIAGFDIGYNFTPAIALGVTYIPMKADIGTGKVDSTSSRSVEVKDHYTIYIEPSYVVNKDASLYARAFYAAASTSSTGFTSKPDDLEGYGGAVGLKTFLNANTFVRAEASYTEYDTISFTSVTTSGGASTTTTGSGTPRIVQGTIAIGYQF